MTRNSWLLVGGCIMGLWFLASAYGQYFAGILGAGMAPVNENAPELEKLRGEFVKRSQQPVRAELTGELRRAMRQETEKYFEYIVREDRSVMEFIDADYTFVNEKLAKHYGIGDVSGNAVARSVVVIAGTATLKAGDEVRPKLTAMTAVKE